MQPWLRLPDADRFLLNNATVPAAFLDDGKPTGDGLARADILVSGDRIEAIGTLAPVPGVPRLDLGRAMVWPTFVDMHTHLDKGHIWPRKPNPDGSFAGAVEAVKADRAASWSASDVRRRMEFGLRSAHAYGTALIRTHLDSLSPQHRISWPVFAELRDEWKGHIDLQAVALSPIPAYLDDAWAKELVGMVAKHGGLLGGATYGMPDLHVALERIFRLAMDHGLDLDFHVDETEDPAARSLRLIAETALRLRFPGKVNVGHCCSLAVQPSDEATATLDLVAEAGLTVVSLPMCNLYLQDRHNGRTPRWRGVTLVHEMRARGTPVAIASDNTRDPFYAYGDLDMVEVFREGVRILHLDHPFADWPAAATRTPAAILGRPDRGRIAAGLLADLVIFSARDWTELLSRPQWDRLVVRQGQALAARLPDYRELDDVMGARHE